jgi:hypothetical protein
MRYLVGFVCVLAALVGTLPQSASAQAGEEAVPKVALAIHTQHRLPPQLMLRASYYLYLDADEKGRSRVERWHPEAFVDPSEPKPTSTPEEQDGFSLPVYVDPLSGAPLAVPEDPQVPTAPLKEEQERKRRRRIGIGVGVSVAVVVILAVLGGVAAAGLRDL